MGASRVVNVQRESLQQVQRELGMDEGFDVGLEMSGNPVAFRDMIENMCHGGKIAMLGIPGEAFSIDWNQVIFNMLTIKGIYGREMYETWYQMTVMVQGGLDVGPVINLSGARNQVEGCVVDALSTAQLEITFSEGATEQGNFDDAFAALDRAYQLMAEVPPNGDPFIAQVLHIRGQDHQIRGPERPFLQAPD